MKEDAYQSHPLWRTLANVVDTYQAISPPADATQRDQWATIGAFIAYLDQYREEEGLLVEENHLNQMNQYLTGMSQQLTNLKTESPNWGHLNNAVNAVPQSMQYLRANFPVPTADSATAAAKRAATMHRKSLETAADEFRDQISALQERLANAEKERLDQHRAFKEELEALRAKAQQGEEQIATQSARLIKQIEEQRSAFEANAEDRAARFNEEVQQREAQAQTYRESLEEHAQETQERLDSAAEAILDRLKSHEATSEALVDTTARNAIAGDYGAWAQRQAKAAFWWTVAAVTLGVATGIGLIVALRSAHHDTTQFALYKTSIGLVGLIVAGYCARQAAEHRREERVAKRLHLDLAALEPFLKQVENADELRSEIARRVFIPQPPEDNQHVPALGFRRGWTIREIGELLNLVGKRSG